MPFGAFAESVTERVEPTNATEEIYVGLDDLDSENLHIRRWGRGSDVIGTKLRFRKGDIIFGRRRAYQRKLAVAEFDGICSAHAMVVRAKPDMALPEFLPFLMMSDRFMKRAVEISVGSLSPTINWTTLKLEEFTLPPLAQQRRIAEILWAVDESLDKHTRLENAILDLLAAHFESAAKSTYKSREVYFSELLQECFDFRGKTPKKLGMEWGGDILALSARNVRMGDIDPSVEANYGSKALYKKWMSRGDAQNGDVILTTEAPLGNVAQIPDNAKYILSQRVVLLRANPAVTTNDFLACLMRSAFFQQTLRANATGTTALGIKVSRLQKIRLSIPNQEVQTKIVTETMAAKKMCEREARYKISLQALFSAQLNQFTGG